MLGFNLRVRYLPVLTVSAAALFALAACGDGETTTSTSSAASTSGGQGGEGQGGGGGGGGGSACVPGTVAAKTIKGTITFSGAATMNDQIVVAAFKDGMMGGAPSGFFISPKGTAPTFPFDYDFTVSLPAENTGMFQVIAYLDVGGNSLMGPGAEDPTAPPLMVTVDDCKGAQADFTLMAP